MAQARIVPLEDLYAGEGGRIVEIDGAEAAVQRLAEMGLRAGVAVRVLKTGSPAILGLDDQRLSFRPEAGTTVLVEVLP
ncbi:MAG: ferrous iron transport protein A [Planctomycetes bacterium]|nr:ferrous iron transport protein A [Planctomycetota bacterium]